MKVPGKIPQWVGEQVVQRGALERGTSVVSGEQENGPRVEVTTPVRVVGKPNDRHAGDVDFIVAPVVGDLDGQIADVRSNG